MDITATGNSSYATRSDKKGRQPPPLRAASEISVGEDLESFFSICISLPFNAHSKIDSDFVGIGETMAVRNC